MNKEKRKISLTEIVLFIVFLLVLTVVLVPTYLSLAKKASITTDSQIAIKMNEIISTETRYQTVEQVIEVLSSHGFILDKLNPTKDNNRFVWDKTSQQILLIDSNFEVVENSISRPYDKSLWELWLTVNSPEQLVSTDKYQINYYINCNNENNFIFDKPANILINSDGFEGELYLGEKNSPLNFFGTYSINGNIEGKVFVNMPNATISINGNINEIEIFQTSKVNLSTIEGFVDKLQINDGFVELKKQTYIEKVIFTTTSSSAVIKNNGIIGQVKSYNLANEEINNIPFVTSIDNTNGYIENLSEDNIIENPEHFVIEIANLEEFENFRDYVNKGLQYKGITVKLINNIELNDGWIPIGNISRNTLNKQSLNVFSGIFDGNNKSIINLNNKGYKPNEKSLSENQDTPIDKKEFIYGLFGVVSNANIKNLNLVNVNIKIDNENEYIGSCVGALIGCSIGSLNIDNVKISNSNQVSAFSNVAGLVGGAYLYQNNNVLNINDLMEEDNQSAQNSQNQSQVIINNCEINIRVTGVNNVALILAQANNFSNSKFMVEVKNCKTMNLVEGQQNVASYFAELGMGEFNISNNVNSANINLKNSQLNENSGNVGVSFAVYNNTLDKQEFRLSAINNTNTGIVKLNDIVLNNPNLNLSFNME